MSIPFDDSYHLLMFNVAASYVALLAAFIPRRFCGYRVAKYLVALSWSYLLGVLFLCLLANYGALPSDTLLRVFIVLIVVASAMFAKELVSTAVLAVACLPLLMIFLLVMQSTVNSFLVDSLGLWAVPVTAYALGIVLAGIIAGFAIKGVISSDWITVPVYSLLLTILVMSSTNVLIIEFITPATTDLACPSPDDGWNNTCIFTFNSDTTIAVVLIVLVCMITLCLQMVAFRNEQRAQQRKQHNKYIKMDVEKRNQSPTSHQLLPLAAITPAPGLASVLSDSSNTTAATTITTTTYKPGKTHKSPPFLSLSSYWGGTRNNNNSNLDIDTAHDMEEGRTNNPTRLPPAKKPLPTRLYSLGSNDIPISELERTLDDDALKRR